MSVVLPDALREYLQQPELRPVWDAARDRLQRNGLVITTSPVWAELDEQGSVLLSRLIGSVVPTRAGKGSQVRLDALDTALRRSAANCGLLSVLTTLTGPLTDLRAERAERSDRRADLWSHVETSLTSAGLGSAWWAATWQHELRRSGILTRAGDDAHTAVSHACTVLRVLHEHLPLTAELDVLARSLPAPARFELAELATRCTGTAHGLDSGSTAGAIVLRALALATGQQAPSSAAAWRLAWDQVGVATDQVSGTVLLWAVRPPGDGPWATMMRARAELGLVTHVTLHEWRQAASAEQWAAAGDVVHVCENPQVLQAAARAEVAVPLLCLSGNPATVAVAVVDALLRSGVNVRYHGDFDVEGVKIASRLIARGVAPWRLTAEEYRRALVTSSAAQQLPLAAVVPATPWDADLAEQMNQSHKAVHEEALLETLLSDLRTASS